MISAPPVALCEFHVLPPVIALGSTISPELIAEAVEDYFDANPPTGGEPLLVAHLADETPHPVYDDIPSLTLLFENGLM